MRRFWEQFNDNFRAWLAHWFGMEYRCQHCAALGKRVLSTGSYPILIQAMCPMCDTVTWWKQDGFFFIRIPQ